MKRSWWASRRQADAALRNAISLRGGRRELVEHLLLNDRFVETGQADALTFGGINGDRWNTAWVFTSGTPGTIDNNRGKLTTGTGSFSGVSAYYDHGLVDVDMRWDITLPTTDTQFPEVRLRFDHVNYDYVRVIFDPNATSIVLQDFDNDSFNSFLDADTLTWAANDVIHLRALVEGTSFKVRYWKNSDPEPGTWNMEATSSLGATNTEVMIRTVTADLGVAVTNYWDNFSFSVPYTPPSVLDTVIAGMNACIVPVSTYPTLTTTKVDSGGSDITSLAVNKPAGVTTGDRVSIYVSWVTFAGASINTPSGFTSVQSVNSNDTSDFNRLTLFEKVLDGSEGSSFTITFTAATYITIVAVGIDSTSARDATATWTNTAYTANRKLPGLTTAGATRTMVGAYSTYFTPSPTTSPAGWTALDSQGNLFLFYKQVPSAGATGDTNFNDPVVFELPVAITAAYAP